METRLEKERAAIKRQRNLVSWLEVPLVIALHIGLYLATFAFLPKYLVFFEFNVSDANLKGLVIPCYLLLALAFHNFVKGLSDLLKEAAGLKDP